MDKFKGTPGPWRIVEVADHPDHKGEQIAFIQSPGVCFDFISVERESIKRKEFTANAQLIAAAPDLLAALTKAKQVICSLKLSMLAHPDCTEGSEFDDLTTSAQEAEDMASVVISKALGGEELC